MSRSRLPLLLCCLAAVTFSFQSVAAATHPAGSQPRPTATSSVAPPKAPSLLSGSKLTGDPHGTWLIPQLRNDVFHLLSRPEFYGIFGGLALAPRALHREDPELNQIWAGQENTADAIFEYGDYMGNPIWPLAAAGLTYSIGKLGHHEGVASFGSDLFRAQTINGIATLTYKVAVHRTRPNGAAYSFPSGHTSVTFTTAGVIFAHFGPYWGGAAALAATYVGLSRLQTNHHYLSDVIGGAIMGSYLGYTISHNSERQRKEKEKALSVSPMVGNGTVGAALSLRF